MENCRNELRFHDLEFFDIPCHIDRRETYLELSHSARNVGRKELSWEWNFAVVQTQHEWTVPTTKYRDSRCFGIL